MSSEQNSPNSGENRTISLERSTLMAGGLLLTLLSQHLMQVSPHHAINFTLLVLGGLSFLLGLLLSSPERVDAFPYTAFGIIARYLNISRIQVLLILYGLSFSLASRSAAGNSLTAHSELHGLIWVLGWSLVVVGCWQRPTKGATSGLDRWDWIALGALLFISLAARVVQLESLPYTVSGDEGSVGLMAWDYRTGARDNILIMGWFSFPALQFLPASWLQHVLGRSILAMRLPSALGGALVVLATYWAIRAMFGRLPGFLAGLFLCAFHYHLLFSRISLPNVWDGFFLMAMIAGLWIGWREDERYAFILAGAAIGLGQYFYTTSHLLPIYALIWSFILRLTRPAEKRLPGFVTLILVLVAVLLPLALFYVENPNELFAPLSRVSLLKPDWIQETTQATGKHAVAIFAEQFRKTVLGFTVAPIIGVYSPGAPMLLTLPATLFLAGLIIAVVRVKDPRYCILLIGLAGPIFASTFSVGPPNAQRLLFSAPIVAALVVQPLFEIWNQLVEARPGYRALVSAAVIAVVAVIGVFEVRFFIKAMDEGRYSDAKSALARHVAEYLQDLADDIQVYFFGHPVMDYHTLPSLPYIAGNATGYDIRLPLDDGQNPPIEGMDIVFVVLPQNVEALSELEQRFPGGEMITKYDEQGQPIFYAYRVQP